MNILKNEGHKMFYAKNGEMAISLCNEHDFDLILLDIMMPDMNGFEVCKILKEKQNMSNTPIIFLSGKDATSDIELAYESGGVDYIVKPFVTIELITKANNYVRLKQLEDKFSKL